MQAFLLINLAETTTFGQPILTWVRQRFPGISTFDVDVNSDAVLQQYAVRLLQETADTVVCVKAGDGEMNRLMPLLEELFKPQPQRMLFIVGKQTRLVRMLQARPGIAFEVVADEEALKGHLSSLI